jgi:hypothetical protein
VDSGKRQREKQRLCLMGKRKFSAMKVPLQRPFVLLFKVYRRERKEIGGEESRSK